MGKIIPKHSHCSFTTYLTAYNFIPHLQIPIEFLKKQAKNMRQNVYLVTDDGESRIVKVEKIGKDYFFTNGWKKIAEELDLRNGELLLFKLVKKSKFHLWVYGINGCCKELCSSDDDNDEQDSKTGKKDDEMDGSASSKIWKLKLTKDHESEMEIPKDLAKYARISARDKRDLVEDKGRKLGRVYISNRNKRNKLYMTAGWNEFLVRNKIVIGSTVSLDFVQGPNNMIRFRLVKSKHGGELFSAKKKTRGRPPNMN